MKELIDRLWRAMALFVMAWGILYGINNVGCSSIGGAEMSPVVSQGGWLTIKPLHNIDDLKAAKEKVVSFGYAGKTFASRIKGIPGEVIQIPSVMSTIDGNDPKDTVEILVPRGCFLLMAENPAIPDCDSRKFGPVGAWAIKGRRLLD